MSNMFTQLILRFFPTKRLVLGRWCLHDKSKNHWKIDMANIDHCGTCTMKPENQKETRTDHSSNKKNDMRKHK